MGKEVAALKTAKGRGFGFEVIPIGGGDRGGFEAEAGTRFGVPEGVGRADPILQERGGWRWKCCLSRKGYRKRSLDSGVFEGVERRLDCEIDGGIPDRIPSESSR